MNPLPHQDQRRLDAAEGWLAVFPEVEAGPQTARPDD